MKHNLVDSNDNMHLIVDSLIDINNILPGWNNINLRNKSYGYEKMCLSKDLIESKLYHLIGQFNERQKVAFILTFIW